MEVGEKLKELNVTAEEIDRFTKAFRDEKFREMLRDYTQEISDPDSRRKYEEEIKILEQERGNSIEFIHPNPFRAIKTSLDGKHKCFINICANEKVGKPECKWVVLEDGRRGQCWSLPHSLHPGRQDRDPKGNKMMIYDVVFHPDTLHMASKNKRFMEMVDSTAIQGIQDAFKVTLDKNNVREMKTKYKGTPQPCVVRKAIPGFKAKEPSDPPNPLAFPYPDEKRPTTFPREAPKATKNCSDVKPKSSQKTREPTKPDYTVKYRSFIDLQDFRCSRDSAQSPRPKEIVVTINLPLLKSTVDTNLEVNEKKLLLESKKPAYRLELPLAYPVDEDKGEAKFDRQRGQLIITLPVLPFNVASDLFVEPATADSDYQSVSDGDSQEDKRKESEQEKLKGVEGQEERQTENWKLEKGVEKSEKEEEQIREGRKGEVEEKSHDFLRGGRQTEDLKLEKGVEKCEKKEESIQEKRQEQIRGEETSAEEVKCKLEKEDQETAEEERGVEAHKSTEVQEEEQKQVNKKEVEQLRKQGNQVEDKLISNHKKSSKDGYERAAEDDASVLKRGLPAEEENSVADKGLVADKQHILISEQCFGVTNEEDVHQSSSLELIPKMMSSDIQEETEETKLNAAGNVQVGTDAGFQNHTPSDKTWITGMSAAKEDCYISGGAVKSSGRPATDEAKTPSSGESDKQVIFCSEGLTANSVKQEEREEIDEDDLPTEQISEHSSKSPPVLREIDKDGNETVISDHSTSAGFTFQNTLMYELD